MESQLVALRVKHYFYNLYGRTHFIIMIYMNIMIHQEIFDVVQISGKIIQLCKLLVTILLM